MRCIRHCLAQLITEREKKKRVLRRVIKRTATFSNLADPPQVRDGAWLPIPFTRNQLLDRLPERNPKFIVVKKLCRQQVRRQYQATYYTARMSMCLRFRLQATIHRVFPRKKRLMTKSHALSPHGGQENPLEFVVGSATESELEASFKNPRIAP